VQQYAGGSVLLMGGSTLEGRYERSHGHGWVGDVDSIEARAAKGSGGPWLGFWREVSLVV
jgi:hypothetical protein